MNVANLLIIAAATPSPIPSDKVPDASKVSPGLPGFIMIFLLAVAVIILARSMNKRIRRVKLRAEEQELEEMAAADEERNQTPGDGSAGEEPDGRPSDEPGQKPGDDSSGRQRPE